MYAKVVYYANIAEVTRYEKTPTRASRRRVQGTLPGLADLSQLSLDGKDLKPKRKPFSLRPSGQAQRTVLALRRIIVANLARFGNPVFASITYADNMCDVSRSRKDWNTFIVGARRQYGATFRYVCTTEFQERGAVHFHALIWGLPPDAVASERSTRIFAKTWGHGFADLVETDGSAKLATYVSKYISKYFNDQRLHGYRLYLCSRNVVYPVVDRAAILSMYDGSVNGVPDLSTGVAVHESDYDTKSLGRAHYKKLYLLGQYANGNAQELRRAPGGVSSL